MKTGYEYLQSKEKRAVDVAGSLLLSPPTVVLSGLTSVALRKEIGGLRKAFFKQVRMGRDGEEVFVSKLRTINESLSKPEAAITYGTFDPRAGKIGAFVRQVGLDEAPQIFDVLNGTMSLVGPRPLLNDDIDKYQCADSKLFDDWYEMYQFVNPGLCGPSQILRHGNYFYDDRQRVESMRLDLEYAENASLSKDILTIINTPYDIIAATVQAHRNKAEAIA